MMWINAAHVVVVSVQRLAEIGGIPSFDHRDCAVRRRNFALFGKQGMLCKPHRYWRVAKAARQYQSGLQPGHKLSVGRYWPQINPITFRIAAIDPDPSGSG